MVMGQALTGPTSVTTAADTGEQSTRPQQFRPSALELIRTIAITADNYQHGQK